MKQAPLVLVDASSYFFRAFHALPPLINSKGQPTGAIYGVANMIKKLIKEVQPEALAVIFDSKGKTFREEWYPAYKAHRPPMPQELSSQFQPLVQLLQTMGFPVLIEEGVEADDVIGTLARQAAEAGLQVLISTSDKDLAQLVNGQVSLINTMSNYKMDIAGVKEKFGVTPEQIIDYLALVGDPVDNIPGVMKCGPKTAAKWLGEFQTLDQIILEAPQMGGKIGEYLRASLSQLPLSKKLVTIKTDVNLTFTLEELKLKPPNKQPLMESLRELEFKTWLKENPEETPEGTSEQRNSAPFHFELVTTRQQLESWLKQLESCKIFCVATQTTGVEVMRAELVGLSFAIGVGKAAYIPFMHREDTPQLDKKEVLAALKPILENPGLGKIGQNIKVDYGIFKNYGIQLQGILYDTLLESYLLNSHLLRHDLDTMALKYLGNKSTSFVELAGKGSKQLRFDQIPIEKAGPYAAEAVELTLRLHQHLFPMLKDSLGLVFRDIEMPLLTVLADMERFGVLIDPEVLKKHGLRLKERLIALEQEAVQLAGRTFNLNSPKQLQEILFEEQKLPVIAKTPTGQASTAESVLQELALDYRLAAVILEYRSLSKLVSTYIDTLPQKMDPQTHRVHTSYNQAITATGRLSSSEPNLQNIPVRSEEGRLIRTAFIAPPEYLILSADYSQIELRIMAHLSQDESLLKAFACGWDVHKATASEIFQIKREEVTFEQRRRAKAVNFGLIYGMSAFGLAKQLGVDRQDAQHYIDIYFQRYPGVMQYMEDTRQKAHRLGYVETLFGRRLYLPEINTSNKMKQKAAERAAINAPLQGTAADIIKKAMLAISQWLALEKNLKVHMMMQVHDELVFEVHKEVLESSKNKICHLMEQTVKLSVPLVVTLGTGANWDAAH